VACRGVRLSSVVPGRRERRRFIADRSVGRLAFGRLALGAASLDVEVSGRCLGERRRWGRPARVDCRGRLSLRPRRLRCGARLPGRRREVIGVADAVYREADSADSLSSAPAARGRPWSPALLAAPHSPRRPAPPPPPAAPGRLGKIRCIPFLERELGIGGPPRTRQCPRPASRRGNVLDANEGGGRSSTELRFVKNRFLVDRPLRRPRSG
jgi:hypothetical protein